ncbi:MAG TPA: 2-hydroxyacyl-CoA dehydratase [Candidatus Dormibacteraeota bacterium]|nr:2-hydroxyacyl-CoA dehydratase [Candidatus Dormibacteraeota bacterium]
MAVATAPAVAGGRLEAILDQCRELAENPDLPAVARWREQHPDGRVVGHFQVYFPEEIVHAAGMLPITVMGAGSRIDAKQADSHIGSFICSICRTSLELGLSGRLDSLSGFFTLPICDVARNLAGIWGRNFPEQVSQILYLPQNATSKHAATYLRGEYQRLVGELETLGGRPITDAALRVSIAVYNENRRLLRQLYDLKRESPWLVTSSEAYVLTRAGSVMPREEHNLLLSEALAALAQRSGRRQDRVRVVFEGGFCEQPPLDMLGLLEETCYVVDDDLLIGMRWLTEDVVAGDDPLEALATAYLEHSTYSCVQHDDRKPKEEMLMARVEEAQAQAVILAAAKMCEPGLDEQVAYQQVCEARGIPHLLLEFEEKMTGLERLRMEVETFVESILFD